MCRPLSPSPPPPAPATQGSEWRNHLVMANQQTGIIQKKNKIKWGHMHASSQHTLATGEAHSRWISFLPHWLPSHLLASQWSSMGQHLDSVGWRQTLFLEPPNPLLSQYSRDTMTWLVFSWHSVQLSSSLLSSSLLSSSSSSYFKTSNTSLKRLRT